MPPKNELVTSPSRVPIHQALVEREPILQTMVSQQVSYPSPQTFKEVRVLGLTYCGQSNPLSPIAGLTTLPPELLTQIFEFVRIENGDSQKLAGISRSLIYYTEVNLYRRVSIASLEKLKRFARTIGAQEEEGDNSTSKQRAARFASLVEYFEFESEPEDEREEGWEDFDGVALFGALSRVKEIAILCCSLLTTDLTSIECTSQHLRSLMSLKITGTVRANEDPFMIGRYAHLKQYRTLETLELSFSRWYAGEMEEFDLPLLHGIDPEFTLPVRHLKIGTHFHGTLSEDLATFLSYFTILETLSIDDCTNRLDFDTVLSNTNNQLLHLSVEREEDPDPEDEVEFGEVLGRFASLQSFTLKYAALDEITILAVQRCTSIRRLHIECGPSHPFPISALKELLHPRVRPTNLNVLKMDGMTLGKEGNDVSLLEVFPKNNMARRTQNWTLPSWDYGFTFKQAKKFVSMALENGVTVTGDLVENMRIERRWNKLKALHAKKKAVSKGTQDADGARRVGEVA